MSKCKQTKKALLSSVIALILCFSMLLGTTFAWFTDSVESGINKIQAGNLDVDLQYKKVVNGVETDWADVQGEDKLFDPNALWEPGHVEVVYLKVSNLGSLALKYQLGVNVKSETIGKTEDGKDIRLSEHLVFKVVEMADPLTTYTDREAVMLAAGTEKGLKDYNGNTKALDPKGGANDEDYVALIVYMPTSVGNEANYRGVDIPTILLGVNLYATQKNAESDSFGPDYDEDAWTEGMKVYNAQDLQAAINAGETNIVLMDDIDLSGPIIIPAPAASTFAMRATPAPVVLNLNGKTITAAYNEGTQKHQYAIDNYGNLVINGGTIEARGIYNREGASMTVNGTKIVNLDTNGGSCIWSYGGSVVLNDAELIGYTGCVYSDGYLEINGGTYTCYAAILDDGTQLTPTYNIRSNSELVINGGNFTSRHGLVAVKGTAVINGGTYTMNSIGVITSHVIYVWGNNAKVTVNGGDFNCDLRTAQNNGSSLICVDADVVDVAVNGGIFNLNPATYLTDSFKAVAVDDGWMVIATNQNYVADGVLVSTDGKTYYISNAAGYAWVDAQSDDFFAGKTVKLTASIDFGGETIKSIRFWNPENKTTFDGQGNSLSNFVISNDGNAGLFNGTLDVKNLIVENATVTGKYVGVIAGNMYGNIDNCTVKNSVVNGTYWQTGALAGQYNAGNVTNCVVDNCTINGKSAVGGLIGILNENAGERKIENCVVKNTDIIQTGSFGGNYDNYFGVAVGLINIENSTVYVNNCTFEDNTLKGAASNKIYGVAESGTEVIVNGATYVMNVTELQKAISDGKTNIAFGADIVGNVTINQNPAAKLVIDGNGYKYDGAMTIKAQSVTEASGSMTIKNVNFKTADEITFITSSETNHYPLNVTVSGCSFEGTGAGGNVVGISVKSAMNLTIENCTAQKVHSILQNTSGWNLTVRNVTVTESGRGMSLGTVQGVTLENVKVEATKYGVRMDAGYNNNAVLTSCDITAFIPVCVRKVSVDSNVTFNGTNTMVATNTDGIWCAIGTSEYETNGVMPSESAKTVTVTVNDAGLNTAGIYNNSGK